MSECLFCKIVAGEIPCGKVYEDASVLAFRDIAPQAPTHILVVPKTHLASVAALTAETAVYAAHCLSAIADIARAEKLDSGFRVISNAGADAGQTVEHLHFHVLGGKSMGERLV
ncbi:MAG: histidine triad nucleotide-binding protein [Oscillospiraceae bacterium]|jgi:histidine triad (HIT) family protein|nr:histidine triad nucleotide-binding protein [Oscillospiraceae bacterium]